MRTQAGSVSPGSREVSMTFKISFHFVIKPEWEHAIREGRKTIDVRVNAEKYAEVKKGDNIYYSSTEVRVRSIRAYPGLEDLLHHEDYRKVVPGAKTADEALHALRGVGFRGDSPHGVLALEIEFIK